jgi:hypothetical protein
MTKKLEDMWSTKFLLPEHKVEIIEQEKELQRLPRPTLDEQEIALVNESIGRSIHTGCWIALTLYGLYRSREVTGTIERVDHQLKQVKFFHAESDEWEWIPLQDIVKAEVKESED